ncbi:MAG TPA: lipase family protein [Cellvibrionaceae bacterium]|nr:lipase family protein [Cellvibrionaceae bacterium]
MTCFSPVEAATLAARVYAVNEGDSFTLSGFLKNPLFLSESTKVMNAQVGFRTVNTVDGFGVCALGAGNYANHIIIVFRGSTSANHGADWASNARIGVEASKTSLPVHIGFNAIFKSMQPEIQSFILQNHSAHMVHCVGHSLGGAVATLAADWISQSLKKSVQLYTFGAPRPGLEPFAKRLSSRIGADNIYRVYHATDPVPMIPIYPFVHAPLPGYGHFIPSSESMVSGAAHFMKNYVRSVEGATWPELSRRAPLYTVEDAVEEFLKSKTRLDPSNPKTWAWLDASLLWILKKVGTAVVGTLHTSFSGVITLVDKIVWVLQYGMEKIKDMNHWVLRFMQKIMQALGMAVAKTAEELTKALLTRVLHYLVVKMTAEAQKAIRNIIG